MVSETETKHKCVDVKERKETSKTTAHLKKETSKTTAHLTFFDVAPFNFSSCKNVKPGFHDAL